VAQQLMQAGVAAEKQHGADHVDRCERERHRHAHEQQDRRSAEQQQGGRLPRHFRASSILQDADTASSRGRRSADASRCMRNTNSIASSANATGIGARSHHSASTSVLMESAPSTKLAAATPIPYHMNTRQQARPMMSPAHSNSQPMRRGSTLTTI